jgi:hypothetical protein
LKKTVIQLLVACYLFFFVTLLGLTALGFLVAGLYLLLAAHLVTWAAALLAGVIVLAVATLLMLMAWLVTRRGSDDSPGEAPAASAGEGGDTAALVMAMMEKADFDARDASIIALVAGTVLGASPELRRSLFGGRREGRDD